MKFIYSKGFVIFCACLSLTLGIVFLQAKGYWDPLRSFFVHSPKPIVSVANKTVSPIKSFFTTIYRLRDIAKENIELRQQNRQLTINSAQLDQYRFENEALKKELGFAQSTSLNLQPCSVLSENPSGLSDTLVLNCGSERGVKLGQAVLSQGFLVGKIVYVSGQFSTALLITSSQFSTDAKVSKTGVTGVVKGSFGSGFYMDELPQSADLQRDYIIVSAGINDLIPANIVIGQVRDIVSKQNDLFKKATLSSQIGLDNLEFVFVAK